MKHWYLFLLLPFLTSFNAHKFYMSNTFIEYSAQNQSYGITIKMFTDDLERAIGANGMHMGTSEEKAEVKVLLENYIRNHFKIAFNDQAQNLSFLGKEVESDLTYCYLEMHQNGDFNTLKVDNTIMTELFSDQKNVVEVRVNGSSKTIVLTGTKTSDIIYH